VDGFHFGLRLAAPSLTATDFSAITLPPNDLPFLNALLALLSSAFVGGLIVSFFAIAFPLKP
jgi:purine-cytosine permease-like protein